MTAILETQGLSRAFNGFHAVSNVSLQVQQGHIHALIGPNGAGKTTLLDLISGFTRPDTGRIRLGDVDLTDARPHRRAALGLGRSFQDSRLFPSLTVEETLMVALERWLDVRDPFNAALRLPPFVDSEAAARHRVDELIELLGKPLVHPIADQLAVAEPVLNEGNIVRGEQVRVDSVTVSPNITAASKIEILASLAGMNSPLR